MIVAQEGCAEWESKLAQEVCEKDEAVFEDAEHGQLAPVISRADLRSERAHAFGDLRRAENFYEPFIHQATTPARTRQAKTAHAKPGGSNWFHLKRRPRLFQPFYCER